MKRELSNTRDIAVPRTRSQMVGLRPRLSANSPRTMYPTIAPVQISG
jgi:hypothetical protein